MKFRCLFKGHVWIIGRAADRVARQMAKPRKSYHNRACCHCGKEEWNADEAEADADRVHAVHDLLRETKRVARLKKVDPAVRPIDPNEFP